MRRLICIMAIPVAVLPLLVGLASASIADNIPTSGPKISCGTKRVFHRPFAVHILGKPITCKRARSILSQGCGPRPDREWSCLSIRESGPFLVWFPSEEVFRGPWSTAIVFDRYPCSKARITPHLFSPSQSDEFPTRRQMLADDLLRCHLLKGVSPQGLQHKIGLPDERLSNGRRLTLVYWLGPERDSYVQIDPEGLRVDFVHGKLDSGFIFQG
jgi:hypothetical protein